jgi:hypothetical protein
MTNLEFTPLVLGISMAAGYLGAVTVVDLHQAARGGAREFRPKGSSALRDRGATVSDQL